MQTLIQTPSGRPIGKIFEQAGSRYACTMSGVLLARYDIATDRTYRMNGVMVCQGDVLASFIWQNPSPR